MLSLLIDRYFSKNAILLENTNNEGIVCPQNSDPSSQEKCTCEGDYVNTLPESSPYFTCIARTPAPTPVPTVTPTLAPTTTSPTFAPTPLLECNSGTYKSNHQCEQCPVDTYSIGAVLECTN